MISRLKPPNVDVRSLTTIASPHRGSALADYMFDHVGPVYIHRLYKALEYFGLETATFSQLDVIDISYYSYGASLESTRLSNFRPSHNVIRELEDARNDGLVSVPSSMWGTYKGNFVRASHLDLINKWMFWQLTGTIRYVYGP